MLGNMFDQWFAPKRPVPEQKPYEYFDTPVGEDVNKKFWCVFKPLTGLALALSCTGNNKFLSMYSLRYILHRSFKIRISISTQKNSECCLYI